jgi:hypothetical protein
MEPYNDSHHAGLRVRASDAGVMRYIDKGSFKKPEKPGRASGECRLAGISITFISAYSTSTNSNSSAISSISSEFKA